MERVPEPELMLDDAQARAYATADFSEPHGRYIELLRARLAGLPAAGRALDLGCGPGDVTIRLARALPGWTVDALDGSSAMLDLARRALIESDVGSRVQLYQAVIPGGDLPHAHYDLLASNSLLHHLADPQALWSTIARLGRATASVFVMDLLRPAGEAAARALVDHYAASEPEILRRDFFNSLRAAYRPHEVRSQLEGARLERLTLEVVSDRHFIVWGHLAPPEPSAGASV
jgi:ubiquinone/menaquinone biosynthesis C-methylase UbiE